ncbi:MAG: NAD-dependent epimerase [Zetaproteobacteria bacterium CG_4_9_14_3_um_filter_49_83]|nr:MAG: NAD-dependent epimerase [Zetaproteobacteria bacterium CG1_02_49_23]PIQ34883.1 MAG: NAD-dependent epimerase [Zetaproteobacteria bacterium CG17_big_fil_post_rev_8_21_14_2_50_50_13]PIV31202.1 MAG: NAD-dependent epimerase [Zetaproteobacteria bacterium CG02_land_8_20_14_3_00_50_9]PIY55829.1 MAG: NAD-dependent epimerase [Zetaproteobacteria bacterium CG_4_10_14_0_8_um_filter_49_80]PJA36181.1 MAG: NAD-dependent epimerase [Zetaproteobacteria bacterium CG_4_9_14_3_um_filter_49_83]
MKVLVLGGNGFIGSHVVDHLLLAGHQVRVFDRSPEHYREPLANVDYQFGQFNDIHRIDEALRDVGAVFHLISTTVPGTSNLDPVADVECNLVGTLQLLEQMRKQSIRRILYLSSGGTVYGNPEISPVPENHSLDPISSYGVVKVAVEKYLYMYQQLYGFQPLVLRPSNLYGPRQGNTGVQGLIGTLLAKMLAGEMLDIWGDGSIIRDYLHVSDLARLSVCALQSETCGVFNAGSGRGFSVNDIVTQIRSLTENDLIVNYSEGRPYDVKEVVLDITRTMRAFDWRPEESLSEGIKDQFLWLKSL